MALLVLASMALLPESEREPTPDSGQKPALAESINAMNRDERLSRIAAGITRLSEPFQEALARMPLDKLAPANEAEARQRLLAVVDQELGRISRIRAMLQQIADADQAEAPARLAFETGTEGDRGRRYILSYERLINRRIDTFLKVRQASASGELDFVELAKELGTEEFAELVSDAGITTAPDTGEMRSVGRTDQESLAQEDVEPCPAPIICSARVSDPTETDDCTFPVRESSVDRATPTDERGVSETYGRDHGQHEQPSLNAGDLRSGVSAVSETLAEHAETHSERESAIVSHYVEMRYGDESILRNEAIAVPDGPAGWGPCPDGDAPGSHPFTPADCVPSQPEAVNPPTCHASQCDDSGQHQRNKPDDAPEEPQNLQNEEPATSPAVRVEGSADSEILDRVNLNGGSSHVNELANSDDRDPRNDEPRVRSAPQAPPRLTTAAIAKLLVPMDRAALDRLTDAELQARRAAMYLVKQGVLCPRTFVVRDQSLALRRQSLALRH